MTSPALRSEVIARAERADELVAAVATLQEDLHGTGLHDVDVAARVPLVEDDLARVEVLRYEGPLREQRDDDEARDTEHDEPLTDRRPAEQEQRLLGDHRDDPEQGSRAD